MSHEVVNGANGSVTWCSGLDCPRCEEHRALNERLQRGETVAWPSTAATPPPIVWPMPNTTAAPPFPFTTYYTIQVTISLPAWRMSYPPVSLAGSEGGPGPSPGGPRI